MRYTAPAKLTASGGTELERALVTEFRRLESALATSPSAVRDGRATTPVRPQPGEFVRVGTGFTVLLPHPRPARGQAVYLLMDGPADVLAMSGLVNGQDVIGVDFAGLVVAVSSGDGWSVTRTPDPASETLDTISATQGTVLYRGASAWEGMAPGTSGRFLQTRGAAANPLWARASTKLATRTSIDAATNATTNLSLASYTAGANTLAVEDVFRFTGLYVYQHDAATTPTLTMEVLLAGVVAASFVFTPVNVAATYSGRVEGYVSIHTIGAGGTAMCTIRHDANGANNTDQQGEGSLNLTATAIDTTLSRSIAARMRMTTAVPANTLTLTQSWLELL